MCFLSSYRLQLIVFFIHFVFLLLLGEASAVNLGMKKKVPALSSDNRFNSLLKVAKSDAIRSGLYGASAGACQILMLMWLRTAVNYQYRYGVSLSEALQTLYRQGGFVRFYQGFLFAIVQGPLAKFGAVAANEGSKVIATAYIDPKYATGFATVIGSLLAVLWRLLLMPIDTCKTVLQVEGPGGLSQIFAQVIQNGRISLLYQGSIATMFATFAGNYPWFYVHNYLDGVMIVPKELSKVVFRSALIGFISSVAADIPSNFIRIIKTVKQSTPVLGDAAPLTYIEIIAMVYEEGGLSGLLFRGLLTKVLANGLQSILFTVMWKLLPLYFNDKKMEKGKVSYSEERRESRHTV